MATVTDLATCHQIVKENSPDIVAIYQYRHAVTNKILYSIEYHYSQGVTLQSGYVSNPVLIWSPSTGWMEGMEPAQPETTKKEV